MMAAVSEHVADAVLASAAQADACTVGHGTLCVPHGAACRWVGWECGCCMLVFLVGDRHIASEEWVSTRQVKLGANGMQALFLTLICAGPRPPHPGIHHAEYLFIIAGYMFLVLPRPFRVRQRFRRGRAAMRHHVRVARISTSSINDPTLVHINQSRNTRVRLTIATQCCQLP